MYGLRWQEVKMKVDKDYPLPKPPSRGITAELRTVMKGDSWRVPSAAVQSWRVLADKIGIKLLTRAERDRKKKLTGKHRVWVI